MADKLVDNLPVAHMHTIERPDSDNGLVDIQTAGRLENPHFLFFPQNYLFINCKNVKTICYLCALQQKNFFIYLEKLLKGYFNYFDEEL